MFKHGENFLKFFGCLFGRENHFIFAVREKFHLRKQNLIKLGGAYVTSTGEPSSKRTSARYGGPTRQTQHGKAVRSCRLLQHTATV